MGFSSRGALKTEDRELPLLLGRGRISLMRRSELVFSDLLAPAAAAAAAAATAAFHCYNGWCGIQLRPTHMPRTAVCLLAECQRTPVWPKRLCIKLGPQRGARGTCEATYGLDPAFTEWRSGGL